MRNRRAESTEGRHNRGEARFHRILAKAQVANRRLRDRAGSCSGPGNSVSSGASNSFRSMPSTGFPSRGSRRCVEARRCLPAHAAVPAGRRAPRFVGQRAAFACTPSRARVACHFPAAGDATSTNQKYGGRHGVPVNHRDPSVGGDERKFSPKRAFHRDDDAQGRLHGATGEGRTAMSASPQEAAV